VPPWRASASRCVQSSQPKFCAACAIATPYFNFAASADACRRVS
jgi:hypothetical protein